MSGNVKNIYEGTHHRELSTFALEVNLDSMRVPEGYVLEANLFGLSREDMEFDRRSDLVSQKYKIRIDHRTLVALRDEINRKLDDSCVDAQRRAKDLEGQKRQLYSRIVATLKNDEEKSKLAQEFL